MVEMLAEQVLQNARLSDDQILMIRTVVGKALTVEAVCEEMVAQHASLHLKEKRTQAHFPRSKGPGYKGGYKSGKGKGYGYLAEFDELEDPYEEAYVAWDSQSQSQSLGGGYEDDGHSYAYQAAPDLDYVEEDEGVIQAFTAMLQEGFDETLDGDAAEFAAEVLQSEGEAYMLRQQATQRGHHGFQNKRYEFRGEMSIEERKARISSLKERTTCKRCGQQGHWANDASCPKGKGKRPHKGAPTASSASSSASTAASKSKGKGKGGPFKPRPVYFAISEPDQAAKTAMMATKNDFTKVPPPTSLDPPRPAVSIAPTSLDGVAPPATLSSLLSWPGRRPEAGRGEARRTEQATAPGTFETALVAPSSTQETEQATAPRTFETALVAPSSSSSSAMVAVAPEHPVNMRLVEGLDMDQQMLIEALRANSDVVLDQMIEAARTMDVTEGEGQLLITQGPMEPTPVPIPLEPSPADEVESLSMASPSESWLEAGLEEREREQEQVVADEVNDETPYPGETQVPAGARGSSAGQCLHARFTTKGTNKHYYLKTCLDCKKVLERRKKEQVDEAPVGYPKKPEDCAHVRVSRQGTNSHVWKWHCQDCGMRKEGRVDQQPSTFGDVLGGTLAGNFQQGPDTPAVKVLELAGAVVMIQESGGVPMGLDRLPSIVEKCAAVYRQREAARTLGANMAASSAVDAPRQTAPKARPGASNLSGDQAGQLSAAHLENVTGNSVLQSGKYKGHTFEKAMKDYPEYADWIVAQTKNLVEVSLRQFRHYVVLQRSRGPAAYMVNEHPPSEDYLLAVLDSGCNQTCHGALWMKKFVEALGKRTIPISLELQDGNLAHGSIESIELEGSEAPLLLSCGAQKQLGIVLDLGNLTAHSRLFGQDLALEDRDGLPAVRLLPFNDQYQQQFAMMVEKDTPAAETTQPDQDIAEEEVHESDFWQHQEGNIEASVLHCAVRRTVAIVEATGEKAEFRDQWLPLRPEELDTRGYLDGPWKGYTYFYRDYEHAHEELKEDRNYESTGMFAAFDEEKPVVLSRGQKKALREHSDNLVREDAAMWAELKGTPDYRRASRLLPRGCRSFVLELFAGAAALTALAVGYGLPTASPIDLQAPGWNLRDPAARQRLQARIEEEDPYLLAVSPVMLPWNSWSTNDLWRPGEQADKIRAGRRDWYDAFVWLCQMVQQRTAQGRQVVLESSWSGLLWETRCLEQVLGQHNPATEQDLELLYVDLSQWGLRDMVSGQLVPKESGVLTASKHTKQALAQRAPRTGEESPTRRHQRARLAAKWPDQLCEAVLQGVFEDLQELNCAVASAVEEGQELSEELGTLDALHRPEDEIDVPMPPPLQPHELQREEVLEEASEPQQAEGEKERKRKWLRLERNQRLAIRRLHHMTGHASNESMMRMLRAAGSSPTVVSACRFFRCQVCLEKKKPPQPSSVTSAPPYQFNHEVGCDAFEIVDAAGGKHTILSLVDSGTKYQVASRVAGGGVPGSKVCSDMFSSSWLAPFGPPKFLVCDQGVHNRGQFAALMASMGTQIRVVGARAPWQLGRTERHGGILKHMMKRIIQQHQVQGEDAINLVAQQCAAVKNGSYNHSGYCPTQWVLGKLPSEVTSLTEEKDIELRQPCGRPRWRRSEDV
ncbi:unnamed protein product, partial [Symbiodinium necroappetens]